MDFDYITTIQDMISYYSKLKGIKSAKELLLERGEDEIPGYLSAHHKIILQEIIGEYASSQGIDIEEEIKNNEGVKRVPTVLSKTEIKYIDSLLELYSLSKENKEKAV